MCPFLDGSEGISAMNLSLLSSAIGLYLKSVIVLRDICNKKDRNQHINQNNDLITQNKRIQTHVTNSSHLILVTSKSLPQASCNSRVQISVEFSRDPTLESSCQ